MHGGIINAMPPALATFHCACDLRLTGPLPRQLARLLTVTGTDQVLTLEDATAGKAAE
ncbi:hypothetical protein ACFWSF_25680 [Streptomyces sp. NPDC058611]|uniref:hypothetical protein n=1 Tax=unclassified Streptomyces TaxID=2593676 RepID=UPI00365ADA2A